MRRLIIKMLFCLAVVAPSICLSGCSTFNAYEQVDPQFARYSHGRVQIQRGHPRPAIDALGRVLAIPNRIALGDSLVDNHNVSPQTEMQITNYLEQNGLSTVLVRSNQYAPLSEYKRMVTNTKIRPIWKATFGNYNLLKYTLLPGRLLGGDWYNPYSDSLHVYSDTPVVAISRSILGHMPRLKTFLWPDWGMRRPPPNWRCGITRIKRRSSTRQLATFSTRV